MTSLITKNTVSILKNSGKWKFKKRKQNIEESVSAENI
nr:MAG TPA: hypothetical protein [Bacteriophage sp.]